MEGGLGGLGGVGAQAGGQSEHCPHPWEDWEAGAESQPHPLQPRVTLHQGAPSLPYSCLGLSPPESFQTPL